MLPDEGQTEAGVAQEGPLLADLRPARRLASAS
jgi:hypothetical protein